MRYQYVACDEQGRSFQGVIESDSEAVAEARLWESNLIIIDLRPQAEQRRPSVDWERWLDRIWPVTSRELGSLWGELADLLSMLAPSGQSENDHAATSALPTGIRLLAERATHPALRRLLVGVSDATAEGESLATALETRTEALSPLTGRLLSAGEGRGELAETLQSLARSEADAADRLGPLPSALMNAALLLAATISGGLFLIWVFLPLLGALETRGPMPWTSASLLASLRTLQDHTWLIIGVIAVVGAGLYVYTRMANARRLLAGLVWRMPLIGRLVQARELAQLCHSLIIMAKADLPRPEMLDLLPHTTGNPLMQEALLGVRSELLDGVPLGEALHRQGLFPPSLSTALSPSHTAASASEGSDPASDDGAETMAFKIGAATARPVRMADEGASQIEVALPLEKLAALAAYYDSQSRDAAHRTGIIIRRIGLACSLVVLAWVLAGLAPAWRAALGTGG